MMSATPPIPVISPRDVLARWLAGSDTPAPVEAVTRHGVPAIVATAEAEGVLNLVNERLAAWPRRDEVPAQLQQAVAAGARGCAMRGMLCLSEARRVQQALVDAGIPCLWLKGIALGQWLYPSSHLRDVADIDLLLPDHATTLRAAEALAPLGYALPNPHVAGDLVVHELLAFSGRAQLELDLHWDPSNNALFAGRLPWATLLAGAVPVAGLGPAALGLSAGHALLHAAFHLAAGRLVWRQDRLRWLYDIHLLALHLDAGGWQSVTDAAVASRLADPLAYALRASQVTFGTPLSAAMLAALEAAARSERVRSSQLHRWSRYQLACWRRWPALRTRVRWLRQLLFPDMAHLRVRYGSEGASPMRITARRLVDGCRRWWGYASRAPR